MARARSGAAGATGRRDAYPNQPYKMLATKDEATLNALVRGIRRKERARAYIQAELTLADDEDREPRRKLIGVLNSKIKELSDNEDDEDGDDD